VVSLYLLLAIAYTFPLILHLSDHTAGTFTKDLYQNLWFLWWSKESLAQGVNPFFSSYIYYPDGVSLYLFISYLSGGIISVPLQALFGQVVAFNCLYYLAVVGCAWGGYCFSYYFTRNSLAAFLGGLIFAFSPWMHFTANQNQMNLLFAQWIPFAAYFLVKFFDLSVPPEVAVGYLKEVSESQQRRKLQIRYGTLVAIMLTLIAYSGFYQILYGAFVGLAITGWYIFRLWRNKYLKLAPRLLLMAALVALPGALGFIPILLGVVRDISSTTFKGTSTDYVGGVDPLGFLFPGGVFGGAYSYPNKWLGIDVPRNTVPIGYVALALAIYGFLKVKESRFWGGIWLTGILLSVGTQVFIGDFKLPTLSALLTKIPVINALRDASRWTIPAFLGLSVLAAWGITVLIRQSGRRGLAVYGVVLTLFLVEMQPFPINFDRWQVPPAPATYAAGVLTQPGALLELPLDERVGDKADNMGYQVQHQRPIMGGYLARPVFYDYSTYFSFFFESLTPPTKDIVGTSQEEITSFLSYYNYSYIVMYKRLEPGREKAFRQIMERVTGLNTKSCVYEDDTVLACQINRPQKLVPYLSLPKGWYGAEQNENGKMQRWLYGQEGFVSAFVPTTGTYRFTFEGASFLKDRSLLVELDGQPAANLTITPGRTAFTIPLKLTEGKHSIRLYSAEKSDKPSANGGAAEDIRNLTILLSQIRLEI
jgi:hypothetical protein